MEFNQENDLWQRLQSERNPMEQRLLVVEMVKLLLENTDMEPSEIDLYDPDDLTDLFLEYQEAGDRVAKFLQKALPRLDPEYKGEPFEDQLEQLKKRIAAAIAKTAEAVEKTKTLKAEEKGLKEEIANLKKARSEADTLQANVEQLTRHRDELLPNLKRLEKLNTSSQGLYAEIQNSLLETIPKMIELLNENYDLHRNHLEENQKIASAFSKTESLPDLATRTAEIHHISRKAAEDLRNFDKALGQFVQSLEAHLNAVRSRRKVG